MKNYWLRILLGALAIFAVGMVGVTLARQGIHHVRGVVEGSGPITVPVTFLPFKLDGERIGTIQHIRINRLAPKAVSSVNILVRLADSVPSSRLEPCLLIAKGFERLNSETTVTCGTPQDTVDEDLTVVGDIITVRDGHSFKLFMPRDAIRELTDSEVVFVGEDSMAAAAEHLTDSILEAKRPTLDSLGVNVPRRSAGARAPKRRVADSSRVR
jgi:hypothetical protein